MFKNIKNKTVVSIYKPVDLPIIDNDELALELDVETIAKQAGRLNIPDTNATIPDSNELNLRSKFERKMLQAQNSAEESVARLRDFIIGIHTKEEINAVFELSNEFDKHLISELSTKIEEISAEKEIYLSVSDDLQVFKKRNKLRRMPDYPDTKFSTISYFIIFIFIETILNGALFAEGSDSGLVGGFLVAAIISCFNVFVGGVFGLLVLRYKNHCQQWKVYSGWSVFAIGIGGSVFFNLGVAHYRTAMMLNYDDAATKAVESFSSGAMSITDAQSWLLFAMGLAFFGAAIYKGYNSDDKYPEYGALARKQDKHQGYLVEKKEIADELIQDIHEDFVEKLEESFKSIQLKSTQTNNCISSLELQKKILNSYHKHLQQSLKYIISRYRDVNTVNRSTDVPAVFKLEIDSTLDYNELDFSHGSKRDDLHKELEHLASSLSKIRQELLVIKENHQVIVKERYIYES